MNVLYILTSVAKSLSASTITKHLTLVTSFHFLFQNEGKMSTNVYRMRSCTEVQDRTILHYC